MSGMEIRNGNRGIYQTACEASAHKLQIDVWMNEGKSNAFISRELEKLGEKISDKSVAKYREYRDNRVQKELEKDPLFQKQMQVASQTLVDGVSKIKQIDIMQHIQNTLEHCAELMQSAKDDDIRVHSVQDLRYVQMTFLEAIKMQADLVMKAQAFQKIEDNPDLLRPHTTINVNAKEALAGILKEVMANGNGTELLEKLRAGIGCNNTGGNDRHIIIDRPGYVDGESEDIEGQAIFVQES